jgi:hypothetical protein
VTWICVVCCGLHLMCKVLFCVTTASGTINFVYHVSIVISLDVQIEMFFICIKSGCVASRTCVVLLRGLGS